MFHSKVSKLVIVGTTSYKYCLPLPSKQHQALVLFSPKQTVLSLPRFQHTLPMQISPRPQETCRLS